MGNISSSKLNTKFDKAGHLPDTAQEPFFESLGLLWIQELRPYFLEMKENIDRQPSSDPPPFTLPRYSTRSNRQLPHQRERKYAGGSTETTKFKLTREIPKFWRRLGPPALHLPPSQPETTQAPPFSALERDCGRTYHLAPNQECVLPPSLCWDGGRQGITEGGGRLGEEDFNGKAFDSQHK
jgi:hypothetical protein